MVIGQLPYETRRTRYIPSNLDMPKAALDQYFKGPGATERYTYGDVAIYDGFNGYSKFELTDGVAHVYLTGTCKRAQKDYTIANLLFANLKQFPQIQAVRLYDANGETQQSGSNGDSVPPCLDPLSLPTPTYTPKINSTITPTPTSQPSLTPLLTRVSVYYAVINQLEKQQPPYEGIALRDIPSDSNVYTAVLDEYFKGPWSSEYDSKGYRHILDGFRNYINLHIDNGVAHIILIGKCEREYTQTSLSQFIMLNLKQFPEIAFVKIYDAEGRTRNPFGRSDSAPDCLEQAPTPTPVADQVPTPITLTPAIPGASATPSPAPIIQGTATRWPTLTPRATDTRWPTRTPKP